MLSRRYRHHGACKRSSIEICHFAPCETNLQHHDFMYVYIYVQVESAQGGWRKFPGLRSATLWDPKTRFAYRRCSGPSQLLSSVLWIRRHFASALFNCDHHFSTLLRPSQLFSIFTTLFNRSQSCSISSHLSSTLFASSLLFSTLLNDSHLCPPRPNSSQLFPPLLTSAQVASPLSQLISTLTFSTLANSSQRLSPPVTEMFTHRASFYTEKHLHTASSYTEKLLQTEAFRHRKLLHTASFCTEKLLHREALHRGSKTSEQAFPQRSLYTKQAFTHSKNLHREAAHSAPTQRELLHREYFTQSKLFHTSAQRSSYTVKLLHTTS